jgi:type III restriction enzyme
LTEDGIKNKQVKIEVIDERVIAVEELSIRENEITKISTMSYADFLKQLSQNLNINIKTLHKVFVGVKVNINNYLNISMIRTLKQKFDSYLLYNAIGKFEIGYQKVANTLHPTKLTNSNGEVLSEINASDIGVLYSDEQVADNYFFDELFYDSLLEKENIKTNISEVLVFTKIPKNSIKIPVAGGKSYSPDFAYVLNFDNGEKKIYFIVETKNINEESLKAEELQKIKHAEKFFGDTVKIRFETQFGNKRIANLIQEIYS